MDWIGSIENLPKRIILHSQIKLGQPKMELLEIDQPESSSALPGYFFIKNMMCNKKAVKWEMQITPSSAAPSRISHVKYHAATLPFFSDIY